MAVEIDEGNRHRWMVPQEALAPAMDSRRSLALARLSSADAALTTAIRIGPAPQLPDVLQRATLETARALGADVGSIWRVSPNPRRQETMAFGVSAREPSGFSVPLASSTLLKAMCETGEAMHSSNSRRDDRFDTPLLSFVPHRSVLIQPFRLRDRVAGMFVFIWTRSRHRCTPTELRLVETVSRQAAATLDRTRLLADVRRRSETLQRHLVNRTARLKRAYEELRISREELRVLAAHTERIRERERTRIAAEIHDELGQALTFLKMELVQFIEGTAPADGIGRLPKLVDDIVVTVRRIASELRPPILDDLGLAAALEWHLRDFEARTGVKGRFRCLGSPPAIDPDRSTALFRIFVEILTNVARHAEATRVQITLACGRTALRLDVRDNGKGIGELPQGREHRLGLLGMQERAAEFGGEVAVSGARGRGTLVRVRIPID